MSEQSVIIKMYPREKHLGNGIWEMAFGKRHLGNDRGPLFLHPTEY